MEKIYRKRKNRTKTREKDTREMQKYEDKNRKIKELCGAREKEMRILNL
jgi:hypothetical protein